MPSKFTTVLPYLLLGVTALGIGLYFGAGTRSTNLDYTDIQKSLVSSTVLPIDFKTVPAFKLLKAPGVAVDESALSGQWTVMVFGFTHCPDVCPIALATMKGVVEDLTSEGATPPQVMFVTVDPKRDTPEVLGKYVTHFHDSFVPISGTLADIHQLINELGVVASYTADEEDATSYTVDHSTSMLLVDSELRVRAKLDVPHTVDNVLADYKVLLAAFN